MQGRKVADTMKNQTHKKDYYICKRLRLLNYLLENGFKPYAETPDPNNIKMRWWLFSNSPELDVALNKYFNKA